MGSFLLALALALLAETGVASRGGRLPRLASLSLSEAVPLNSGKVLFTKPLAHSGKVLFTKPLAHLPITALEASGRDAQRDNAINIFVNECMTCTYLVTGTAAYALLFIHHSNTLLFSLGFTVTGVVALDRMLRVVEKGIQLRRMKKILRHVAEATASDNSIVIYEHDGARHVGLLSVNEGTFTVIDAQGDAQAVASEQLQHLITLRDGLPYDSFAKWMLSAEEGIAAISTDFADQYRGATLAFAQEGRNYLGTVADVSFSADGQGELRAVTASGEEVHISRGRRGQPIVIDPHTGKKNKLRGVVFLP